MLIANDGAPGRTAPILGTLIRPGIGIPVLGISSALGSELARDGSVRVRIDVAAVTRRARSQNVIADLPGRRPGAVLLGAHLDSVAIGPGMNDNASARRSCWRSRGRPAASVSTGAGTPLRVLGRGRSSVWWARPPTRSLGTRIRQELSAVLNFDMVASPNFGRFVYDGEAEPPGSTRIEDHFQAFFSEEGLAVEEALGARRTTRPLPGPVAVGGLFHRADAPKQRDLTSRFGGAAGRPYDACYRSRATRSTTSTSASSARWPMPPRSWRCASPARPRPEPPLL